MEDALVLYEDNQIQEVIENVLFLVVMEDALVHGNV